MEIGVSSKTILNLWRGVRQANFEAVRQYYGSSNRDNAILMLELAMRRTDTLIAALKKERPADALPGNLRPAHPEPK